MTASDRLGWYWHRLRAMGPAEIGKRMLSKARLWIESPAGRALDEFALGGATGGCPRLPDRRVATEPLRQAVSVEAASIREGRWLLFGWREVRVSTPPLWHRDYLHGSNAAPGGTGRQVDHRRLAGGTDARCVWETNRWAEMVRLAQNAWLNEVPGDARLAQEWLFDWIDKNPIGRGINWCSALEAGLRLVNFCWIDALVRAIDDPDLTGVQDDLAQRVLPGHARWVWRHRSVGSSANNHLLGELAGIVMAARRWPCLAPVACPAEQAWDLLSAQVLRQFDEDGGSREQALHYQLFAWELAWQAARAMGGEEGAAAERLRAAAASFCALAHAEEPWDFGDSDDAQVTPLARTRRTAVPEWKAWMLDLQPAGALRFWLGQPPRSVCRLAPGHWRVFPSTGLAVRETTGWKARADGSPLGFGSMAAHGHLDAMHVSLWDGDHALVVDPGTGAYYGDPALRATLASWEFHNGPVPLSGRPLPRRLGPFLWGPPHRPPELAVTGEACSIRFLDEHFTIDRRISYVSADDAWLVTDETPGHEPYVVRWRLSPDWAVSSRRDPTITIAHPSGQLAALTVASERLLGCEVGDGVVSPRFGEVLTGPLITITFIGRLESQWRRLPPATRQ